MSSFELATAPKIIIAACVLHNICLLHNDQPDAEHIHDDQDVDIAVAEQLQELSTKLEALDEAAQKEADLIMWRAELGKKDLYAERRTLLKKVPEFWSTIILGLFMEAMDVQESEAAEAEQAIVHHVEDVWIELDAKDPRSGKITFTFSDNPYFKEKELTKSWTGSSADGTFKVQYPKPTWTKKPESSGFLSWLTEATDEDLVRTLCLEVYPGAVDAFFDENDELDGSSGSEDLSDESDEEPAKPTKKQRKN